MEFLRLEQELAQFCPYSELEVGGRSKYSKFESGLKPKLKTMLRHQEISDFATLVNKCRMVEDDMMADDVMTPKPLPPKHSGPQRNFSHEKGKGKVFHEERRPYSRPTGSRVNVAELILSVNAVRVERPCSTGRLFTMSGAEVSSTDGMIKGNCMVAGIPLLVLFDSGATHSFVSIECVDRLKFQTESLPFDLVVSTPTDVPVVVSTVVSRCHCEDGDLSQPIAKLLMMLTMSSNAKRRLANQKSKKLICVV
ncbi:hypothetical protein Lal_00032316 [Lupinus albus]|nr:hypothetical protein Lal_00032316 [Lupinus albus]